MRIHELLFEKQGPTFVPNVGAVHVKFTLVPEQEQALKEKGIPLPATDAYVVYAYEIGYEDKDLLDRLKSRNQYASAEGNREELIDIIDSSIDVIRKVGDPKNKWESTKEGVRQLQAFFANGSKVIVVPAPSSASTASLVAERIAAKTGAKYINIFKKQTHPPISYSQLQRERPGQDTSDIPNPATFKQEMLDAEVEMEKALENGDDKAFYHWAQQYELLKKRYEGFSYKRKTYQYPHNAHIGRSIYNTIDVASPQAPQLHGAYVIIADDNVIQGHTISEAVKALWLQGIIPKRVVGFVPHRLHTKPR